MQVKCQIAVEVEIFSVQSQVPRAVSQDAFELASKGKWKLLVGTKLDEGYQE